MIGKLIAQRYQVEAELGSGGMGTVYQGIDKHTQESIAIKLLNPTVLQHDSGMLERFRREGEALRQLNHPNIVKMLDAIDEGDRHYLVMEYVQGGDLSSLITSGRLPINQILNIALDLCDALTRAHRLQIIHRDLKPANVLIDKDGIPKLTDFGVAHIGTEERVTATESVIGTIDYLAPEALSSGNVDVRTDIWSFGVMLYEMLAGERPFTGSTYSQVILHILQAPPADLENLRSDIPIALVDLIYRMLEKDPYARIPSVRLVGAELEALLQESSTDTSVISARISDAASRFQTPTPQVKQHRHNLPAHTTPFVGRETELMELERLLGDTNVRLITIVAPGGMGKTRLSLQAAEYQLDNFSDGVYFVELAPITDKTGIIPTIAEATGYQFQSDGRAEKQQLLDYLSAKEALLVIDNWEHVIDGSSLVSDILNAAPKVQIMATSRLRLSQPGEALFQLSGMDFPAWETPDDALEYAAMKLFMNSATRAQPAFELTVDNLDVVARICRLVQGMPLGIVLAAAWLAMLSLEEIAQEIQQGIDILEDEAGVVPERQRSIRAVFDYSWQQMSEAEQEIFMKMSVFRGGFTRDAAQKVTKTTLRQLMSMGNKSLILRDNENGRYQIHELLRQYAHEHLVNSAQTDSVLAEHEAYYLELLATQSSALKGTNQINTLNTIETDFDNFMLAWQHALTTRDVERINNAIEPLELFCIMRSRLHDGRNLFQRARQVFSDVTHEQTGHLAHRLRVRFHDTDTSTANLRQYLEEALQAAQTASDTVETAYCFLKLGEIAHNHEQNPDRAIENFEHAVSLYRQSDDSYYLGDTLSRLGEAYQVKGDFEKTEKLVQESYELQKSSGDEYGQAKTLRALGMFAFMAGDYLNGNLFTQQAYDIHVLTKNLAGQAETLLFVGWLTYASGQLDKGYKQVESSFQIAKELRLGSTHAWTLAFLSGADSYAGNLEEAKSKLQEAESVETNPFQQTGAGDVWLQVFITWIKSVYQVAIGDYHGAKVTLRPAWEFAHQSYSYGFLISFMPIAAILYSQEDRAKKASEVIGLIYSINSASTAWLESWSLFNNLQVNLKQKLGEEAFQQSYNYGATQDVMVIAGEILNDLWDEA